jgi:predicted NAD/FAD-dependent oxidoreductase
MATRRNEIGSGLVSFDHGAQYFTARDPAFLTEVNAWASAGHVARWPMAGTDAWVGMPAMNAPVKALAADLDVAWSAKVEAIVQRSGWRLHGNGLDESPFDAVIVAVPAEQAEALLAPHSPEMAHLAGATRSSPCWTVMAAFEAAVPVDDIVRAAGPIGWAARNSAKPGRSGPESWVIQSGPEWSKDHLDMPAEQVAALLLAAFATHVGQPMPAVVALTAHRWRYARSGTLGRDFLWDPKSGIGVCGDWLLGPRVENAWLSGRRLAKAIGIAT